VLWAVLRFGVLAWLSDKNHPVRPVVEALSWVAGVAGFVVALVALMLTRRQAREAADASGVLEENRPSSTEKFRNVFLNSHGIQIGDHNDQKNTFKTRFTCRKRNARNSGP
jgi:hypothetical protein